MDDLLSEKWLKLLYGRCKTMIDRPSRHENFFDFLPDDAMVSIFNQLQDWKSLCFSKCVCRRFRSLPPQVDKILITIPRESKSESNRKIKKNSSKNRTPIEPISELRPVDYSDLQYFYVLDQVLKPASENPSLGSVVFSFPYSSYDIRPFYDPNEFLKSFPRIRSLHLKLGSKENRRRRTFIKWRAEFGKHFHNCIVLGAHSVKKRRRIIINGDDQAERSRTASVISEDELNLRHTWAGSCLVAASIRLRLIQRTLNDHDNVIENVVVSDEKDEGWICMNREQVQELRRRDNNKGFDGQLMILRTKMWYLEKLELPDSGQVMEGATLMVIRPVVAVGAEKEMGQMSDEDLVATAAFGGEKDGKVIREALVRFMIAKNCYTCETESHGWSVSIIPFVY